MFRNVSTSRLGFALLALSLFVLIPSSAQAEEKARALDLKGDRSVGLDFPQAPSSFEIYRKIGEVCELGLLFDPRLQDQEIELRSKALPCKMALDAVAELAGHFYKVLDPRTAMLIQDTPQNRREHEDQLVRTFFLDNLKIKDAVVLLRSLLQAHHVAANEDLNALVLRDSGEKVALAERLLATHDRPQAEVEVAVEVLRFSRGRLAVLEEGEGVPLRLSPAELAELKRQGQAVLVSRPRLSILDGGEGTLELGDRLHLAPRSGARAAVTSTAEAEPRQVGLALELRPRVHRARDEVTLEVAVSVRNLVLSAEGRSEGRRSLESQIRLASGEVFLVTGLSEAGSGPVEAVAGASQLARLLVASPEAPAAAGHELLLAISPRIVHRATPDPRSHDPLAVSSAALLPAE